MRFALSAHAADQLRERHIPPHVLEAVLTSPEQIVPAYRGLVAYQSWVRFGQRTFLIRAIVNDSTEPPQVVTVYRTSKIAKYWRSS